MQGLELSRQFYFGCVQPLIAIHLPELANLHAAGLIGYGSDVLGHDDELSRDHEWGPRLILFLREVEHHRFAAVLDQIFNEHVPGTFLGFPTRFEPDEGQGGVSVMTVSSQGRHHIAITTAERFMELTLGFRIIPQVELDWLLIPEQRLLEFTRGTIFVDPVGDITSYREKLAYFPESVWKYRLSYIFESLAWELDLISLCGERGDILSMRLNTALTVERIMKLAFLLYRKYCPGYKKWLQREFAELPGSHQVEALLDKALDADHYGEIVNYLNKALAWLYPTLRQLDIAPELPVELPQKNYRGQIVPDTQKVARGLLESISGPLGQLKLHGAVYGAVDQWLTNEDILLSPEHVNSLLPVYHSTEPERKLTGEDII